MAQCAMRYLYLYEGARVQARGEAELSWQGDTNTQSLQRLGRRVFLAEPVAALTMRLRTPWPRVRKAAAPGIADLQG